MSLRTFLYAADALRLEEGISFVVDGGPAMSVASVPSPTDTAARNVQSMQMLQGILGGVQKKKGARR